MGRISVMPLSSNDPMREAIKTFVVFSGARRACLESHERPFLDICNAIGMTVSYLKM